MHEKTVILALEALLYKKVGLLPICEFCPKEHSHSTLACAVLKGALL